MRFSDISCHEPVKGKNFESNSQHSFSIFVWSAVVMNLSKVKISKAIHNFTRFIIFCISVVMNLSKVKISKAIHNKLIIILLSLSLS